MWPQDIDLSLDNQYRAVWAELSSDFGWSVEQPGRGPFWAVGVGGFSLVSRATRLGATMGDLGRRISAGQWGNQAGGHSGRPETADFRWSVGQPVRALLRVPRAPQPPGTLCPCRQGHWGVGKSAGQSGQPSLQRLPALQHLPGCVFLKSYLNTPPSGAG